MNDVIEYFDCCRGRNGGWKVEVFGAPSVRKEERKDGRKNVWEFSEMSNRGQWILVWVEGKI